jgi:DNA-directed RNA polymerase subunit K/omega
LQGGARSYLPTTSKKPTVVAMEEVRRGLVQYEDLTLLAAQAAAELAAAEKK